MYRQNPIRFTSNPADFVVLVIQNIFCWLKNFLWLWILPLLTLNSSHDFYYTLCLAGCTCDEMLWVIWFFLLHWSLSGSASVFTCQCKTFDEIGILYSANIWINSNVRCWKNWMWKTDSLATSFVLYLLFGCLARALTREHLFFNLFQTHYYFRNRSSSTLCT